MDHIEAGADDPVRCCCTRVDSQEPWYFSIVDVFGTNTQYFTSNPSKHTSETPQTPNIFQIRSKKRLNHPPPTTTRFSTFSQFLIKITPKPASNTPNFPNRRVRAQRTYYPFCTHINKTVNNSIFNTEYLI
jgi:hypothetical protein